MIVLLGIPVLFIIIVLFVLSLQSSDSEEKEASWHAFANSAQLRFIPGSIGHNDVVSGQYHSYEVHLETFEELVTKATIATRLSLVSATNKDVSDKATIHTLANDLETTTLFLKGLINTQVHRKNERLFYYEQSGLEIDKEYLQKALDLLCDIAEIYPVTSSLTPRDVPALYQLAENKSR
ncbi:MAG: hypothetical protein AAF485_11550, partial [Chloroflexota bacterium]